MQGQATRKVVRGMCKRDSHGVLLVEGIGTDAILPSVQVGKIRKVLRSFLLERAYEIDERDKLEREIEDRESQRKAITYEEFVARNGKMENFDRNPLSNAIDTVSEEKPKVSTIPKEDLLVMAKSIVENSYKADKETLESIRNTFRKHTNVEPEDYLETYENL